MINVVWRNETLQYLPSYERLRDLIFLVYNIIKEIPLNLKRVECHLYENCFTKTLLEVRTQYVYFNQLNKSIIIVYTLYFP